MENNCKRYWRKALILIMTPVTRLRKILRKANMRQMKIAVGVLIVFSCIATLISYYWYRFTFLNIYRHNENNIDIDILVTDSFIRGTPIKGVGLDVAYKDIKELHDHDDDELFEKGQPEVYMINTPGCKIPFKSLNYEKTLKSDKRKVKCGKRAIFLRKSNGSTVISSIKTYILQKYMKHKDNDIYCCYKTMSNAILSSERHDHKIEFSNCTRFYDNTKITLQTDFINIKCFEHNPERNQTFALYEDKFAFTKKLNTSIREKSNCKIKYNVILLGMDSMSFYRTAQTLSRTLEYFNDQYWLAYKAYHKIADNTFPNLMAAFTGKNLSRIEEKCSGKMDDCNRDMIWSEFKEAGYVTAYGEDYLQLPDTFTNEYAFRKAPTDHYIRPFFHKSEYRRQNSTFLCTGRVSSGQQILNYALDFAQTYKKQSFFGLFWINSFSHDAKSNPHEADKMLENFFYQLTYTGILRNTFIIFFSDHGLRFGQPRFEVEAYYDDRLPTFLVWTPSIFKQLYPNKYNTIIGNQFRLVTPYDFYSTLLDIKEISMCTNKSADPPEGCPNCHSIFKLVSANRTCDDVSISEKWCSCHKLYPLPVQDTEALKSVEVVVNHLKSMVKTIETQKCWGCMSLSLKTIFRIHFYHHEDRLSLYYVVAFSMTPGNTSYEATVLRKGFEAHGSVVGPISVISNYRGLGKCAIHHRDRLFCVCQKKDNC